MPILSEDLIDGAVKSGQGPNERAGREGAAGRTARGVRPGQRQSSDSHRDPLVHRGKGNPPLVPTAAENHVRYLRFAATGQRSGRASVPARLFAVASSSSS